MTERGRVRESLRTAHGRLNSAAEETVHDTTAHRPTRAVKRAQVGRYRRVFVHSWQRWQGLAADALLLTLYLLAGPQTNRIGLFVVSIALAEEQLRLSKSRLAKLFQTLCARFGWRYDAEARVVFITDWWTDNRDTGQAWQSFVGALRDLAAVPNTPLVREWAAATWAAFPHFSEHLDDALAQHPMGIRWASDGHGEGIRSQDLDLEHDLERDQDHEDKRPTASRAPAAAADAEAFVEAWNEITTLPIPRVRELTARRREQIAARLRERSLDEWRGIFARIEASPFCRGENDRGWLAKLDWVMRPDTAVKVLEGHYDPRPRPAPLAGARVQHHDGDAGDAGTARSSVDDTFAAARAAFVAKGVAR